MQRKVKTENSFASHILAKVFFHLFPYTVSKPARERVWSQFRGYATTKLSHLLSCSCELSSVFTFAIWEERILLLGWTIGHLKFWSSKANIFSGASFCYVTYVYSVGTFGWLNPDFVPRNRSVCIVQIKFKYIWSNASKYSSRRKRSLKHRLLIWGKYHQCLFYVVYILWHPLKAWLILLRCELMLARSKMRDR